MQRLVVAALALGLGACGVEEDKRPRTLEYITVAVLAPNCGNAQCHSSFRRVDDYAFDTVEETRDTIVTYTGLVVPGSAEESVLYQVLVAPGGDEPSDIPRMPFDQPLPNADVQLIYDWIDQGAVGVTP